MLFNYKHRGKSIRIFLFGDYEFLCHMYGLTGAQGNNHNTMYTLTQRMVRMMMIPSLGRTASMFVVHHHL